MALMCVGTLAIDTVETATGRRERVLGGSASYFAYAAGFFTPVRIIGRVGNDWPDQYTQWLTDQGADWSGVHHDPEAKTYFWSGRYTPDYQDRETLAIEMHGFDAYHPEVPPAFRDSRSIFLAAAVPAVQLRMLEQCAAPKWVFADTVDMWIETAREDLLRVLQRIDGLFINDAEARQLTGEHQSVRAAMAIQRLGPRWVILKKGEHGCLVAGPDGLFALPGFPTDQLVDPTGAGDSFAGGVLGMLAECDALDRTSMHRACMVGTAIASITLSDFSLDALRRVNRAQIDARVREYRAMLEGAGSSQFSRFVP